MRRILVVLLIVVGSLATAAQQEAAKAEKSELPSKATVESFLKHWFGYDPAINPQVGAITESEIPGVAQVTISLTTGGEQRSLVMYVMPDQQHTIVGEVLPFGSDPFVHVREELSKSATGIARGPDHAAVTIVEFSDLECPVCKQAQPTLDRLLGDYPNMKFVFQQFPLDYIHPWSLKAAHWADCVGRENNAAFWKFAQTVYDHQLEIDLANADARFKQYAADAGVPGEATATCAAGPQVKERVRESIALGKRLGVGGTPTVFVNGRKIVGVVNMPYDTLKAIVEYAGKK